MIQVADTPSSDRAGKLEFVLFLVICAVTFLRATYIEAPNIEQGTSSADPQTVSLVFSSILLGCFIIWFAKQLAGKVFSWRRTWFGAAAGLFIAAGMIALTQASDKRAAITDLVTLASPVIAGLLLVQLLQSRANIRLVMFILLAIAAAAAAMCADQYFSTNETLIADYESNPAAHLERLGIEAGSLEQWMYEHRLYSKGVRGFLMTANSTASFLILAAFAGIGLCADSLKSLKQICDKQLKEHTLSAIICYALITVVVIAGLLLTQSKGGIGAFAIGLLLFALMSLAGKFIWSKRRLFGSVATVVIIASVVFIVSYGMKHDRLPGGNSMFVRWQYWTSTAKMIADHPLGVGGANFAVFYPQYKIAAASETVQDPHNWLLSLLAQYGPLGVLAFIVAILWPLYKTAKNEFDPVQTLNANRQFKEKANLVVFLSITALLLFVRPFLIGSDYNSAESAQSAAYGYIILYLVPAAVFAGVFFLLYRAAAGDVSANTAQPQHYLSIALICGVLSVLIHNLIDFAIFEPGVWGCLWLVIAVLIASIHEERKERTKQLVLSRRVKIVAAFSMGLIAVLYLCFAVAMPVLSNSLFNHAIAQAIGLEIIDKPISADPLSGDAAYKAAAVIAQSTRQAGAQAKGLLENAVEYSQTANKRNPAEFKILRLQANIYQQLSKLSMGPEKTELLVKALTACQEAIARYPGADRLHFQAAQIAEVLGKKQEAIEHYKAAVEIEDAFRQQFKSMYPTQQGIVSRLGIANYNTAQEKIKELQPSK